ncbi:helix-turn-helix transcriptional regulator [Aureimonas sp. Leaf427]|nr:S24 family peptidase [Aureimonas sp. Leaf427]
MGSDNLKDRVQERLAALEKGPVETAIAGGLERNFILDILVGKKKSVRADGLKKLADALRTTPRWLMGEEETPLLILPNPERHAQLLTIGTRLKGYIGDGGEIVETGDGDAGLVETPPGAVDETFAAEVKGLSMMPVYEDGTLIYWSKMLPPADMINKRCIVKLMDGRLFVKTLRASSTKDEWDLESINPAYPTIENVSVEWVAKIDWTKPG